MKDDIKSRSRSLYIDLDAEIKFLDESISLLDEFVCGLTLAQSDSLEIFEIKNLDSEWLDEFEKIYQKDYKENLKIQLENITAKIKVLNERISKGNVDEEYSY